MRRASTTAPTRTFRGGYVALGIGGALVAALCGYGIYQDSQASCVEKSTQTVVDEELCRQPSTTHGWYYGGSRGLVGDKVTGGSFERGGFGGGFLHGGG